MKLQTTRAAAVLSFMLLALPAGAAENDSLEALLIEKGFITQSELEEAQAEAAKKTPPAEATPAAVPAAEEPKKEEPQFKASATNKGLIVESTDGAFIFGLGGVLQYDVGGFSGGQTPLGTGSQLRRARLITRGTVWSDWNYKLEVNFDNSGSVSIADAYVQYAGFKPVTVTLGNQKVPFSQQSMTSSNWQVFQERALPDVFEDNSEEGRRRVGAVIQSYGKFWNAAAGVFGAGVSAPTNGNTEDWGTAGRLVFFPIAGPTRLVTLGSSIYYRNFESTDSLTFASRPEANLSAYQFVSTAGTGTVGGQSIPLLSDATGSLMFNIESSFVWNAFHAQAEFTGVSVDRVAQSTVNFNGWYVQGGWFITGESRNYDTKVAQFKGITPKHKYGAWELALRYSSLDLQTKDIRGGEEQNVTVALNWWVNTNVMFRLNYVRAMMDPTTSYLPIIPNPVPLGTGAGTIQAPGAGLDQSINAFMGRVQIVF